MADIKLDFGVEGLDGLKKLLTEIEKSAKRLTALIEKAGAVTDDDVLKAKRLAAEYKKAENELKKQELASKRIADQQERVNQKQRESKGIIGGLEREVRKLRSELRSATNTQDIDRLNKKLRETQDQLQKAKGTTASWGKALGSFQFKFNALGNIAANVFQRITTEISQAVREAIRLSLQAEGVEKAFARIGSQKILQGLRDATKGTVTDLELMRRAVMANNFQIPLEQLASLFEFATKRAQDTGESVDYLVNSIVIGIGRKSPLILDNLGISAVELRQKLDNVGHSGATVLQVAKAVAEIAEEAMEKAGGVADTAAIKFERMRVVWSNILTDLTSELRDMAMVVDDEYRTALYAITSNEHISAWRKLAAAVFWTDHDVIKYGNSLIALQDETKTMTRDLNAMTKQEELLQKSIFKTDFKQSYLWAMSMAIGEMPEKIDEAKKAMEEFIDSLQEEESIAEFFGFDEDDTDWILPVIKKVYADRGDEYQKHLEWLEKQNDEHLDGELKKQKDHQEMIEDLRKDSFRLAAQGLTNYAALVESQKQKELSAAGDSAKAREAIERRYAEKQRKLAIFEALIAGGAASAKAWQQYGWPWALVPQAIIAADVGAQIATISNAKYAEGGEIFGEPHSRGGVNIEAEGGEYVINKRSTSKYKDLIRAINEDDQVRIMDAMSRDRKIEINKGQDPWTKKMYEHMKGTVSYWEDNEFFYTKKGNITHKIRKN